MSAIILKVTPGRVICRKRESDGPYDSFKLMGAVVVDRAMHPFQYDPIATNETIQTTIPWQEPLFDGQAQSTEVGVILRAYDIDDNDKWRANREEVLKWNSLVASLVALIPGGGLSLAPVIEAWPGYVDKFVELDHNDLLLDAAFTVALPAPSRQPGTPPVHHQVRARSRSDLPYVASWDYEVEVDFVYSSADLLSFPAGTATTTYTPVSNARREQWLGTWDASLPADGTDLTTDRHRAPVTVTVRPSQAGSGVDVTVTERVGPGRTLECQNVRTPHVVAQAQDVVGTVHPDSGRTPLAGVFGHGAPGSSPTGPGGLRGSVKGNSASTRPAVAQLVHAGDGSAQVGGVDQAGQGLPFGTDVLRLDEDAVLEMYQVAVNGHPTDQVALRYRRPAGGAVTAPALGSCVNEMLHLVPA